MKTIKINGRTFEVKESRVYPVTIERVNDYMTRVFRCRTLDDCYDRPSDTKKEIWNDWVCWEVDSRVNDLDFEISHLQVASYNSMMFTIDAIAFDEMGYAKYMLHITRDHNYAYPIVIE